MGRVGLCSVDSDAFLKKRGSELGGGCLKCNANLMSQFNLRTTTQTGLCFQVSLLGKPVPIAFNK